MLETNFMTALDLKPEASVSLVAGGAVLAVDDRVHLDLDRSHTVLSPNEARQFAAEPQKNRRCDRSLVAK
jgi:hypothetical protein